VGAARTVTAGVVVRTARGLSGVLAGGLVVLAMVVCVAQWLASTSGRPGLGMPAVAGHIVAASVAVVLQLAADRCRPPIAVLSSGLVLLIAAGVLWFAWWA